MRHGDTARACGGAEPRESDIQREIRLAAGRAVPGCVLFRNNTGVAIHAPGTRAEAVVRYGVGGKGGADLIGWLRVRALAGFLAVEVKTSTGRLTAEQRMFGELVERAGGVFIVARSVDDFVQQATAARARLELALAHPEATA